MDDVILETIVAAFHIPGHIGSHPSVGFVYVVSNVGRVYRFDLNTRVWNYVSQCPTRKVEN